MEVVEGLFGGLTGILWENWMLYLLVELGVFYTVVTKGIQIRSVPRVIRGFGGRDKKKTKIPGQDDGQGTLSSVQALCMAIASCVGSGNTVETATVLIAGSPNALFWVWVATFSGMATKYTEIMLGLLYREKTEERIYQGGPMYYIAHELHAPWLRVVTVMLLFLQNTGTTLVQSNTVSSILLDIGHMPRPATGIILAITVSFIVRGGLKRLAHVAQRIVSVMVGLYIIDGTVVVLSSLDSSLPMLSSIVRGAFSLEAGMGTVAGVTMKEAMRFSVARGPYSNEAGEGSAAVIHSSANMDHPARQRFYDMVEMFVDTIVICSTAGFAILSSGIPMEGTSAASLAAAAFGTVFSAFRYIVSVSLVLFTVTSTMSQWYFGHVSLVYIKGKRGAIICRVLFPILILCGNLSTVGLIWSIQDCMLGLLTIPNVITLFVMSPEVSRATKEFFIKRRNGDE